MDQSHSLASVERYNPAIDSWEIVAPLAVARRSVAVAAHAGRLYAMGGSGACKYTFNYVIWWQFVAQLSFSHLVYKALSCGALKG